MACVTRKKRFPGRWCIDFYDQFGRRRLEVMKEGTTRDVARERLKEIEEQVSRRTFTCKAETPTFSHVAEAWLGYKKGQVRENTHKSYRGYVKKHLKPFFGAARINMINFDAVERFVNIMLKDGMIEKPKKEEGERKTLVDTPTLNKIVKTLGQILKYSVKKRYIDFNVVREIDLPKIRKKEKAPIRILKPAEIRALLSKTIGQKYKMLFKLATMSGMREGELLGVRWIDMDWFNSQICVEQNFNHGQFYPPKSKTSRRRIDLGPSVIADLKKWKLACPANDHDLIFPNEQGKPMDAMNMLNRHFWPTLTKAGLPRRRFHDLRHTFASLLIDQGEHPKYIQQQMGHSSINVTMDIYGHLMNKVNQEAAVRLDKAVFDDDGDFLETKTVNVV